MYRRILVLSLLLVGLAFIVAPAVLALRALMLGDVDGAWRVFAPVLLIPLGFLVLGVVLPLRAGNDGRDRNRGRDRGRDTRRRSPAA